MWDGSKQLPRDVVAVFEGGGPLEKKMGRPDSSMSGIGAWGCTLLSIVSGHREIYVHLLNVTVVPSSWRLADLYCYQPWCRTRNCG